MKSAFFLLLAIVAICSVSCGLGMPDRNVSRVISPTELIGDWELTSESLACLIADGYIDEGLDCTISFRADRTAVFSSVKDGSSPRHEVRSGFWKIGPCRINGETRVSISENRPSDFGFVSFAFTDDHGSLRLWEFHGDPDMWEFVEYTRFK